MDTGRTPGGKDRDKGGAEEAKEHLSFPANHQKLGGDMGQIHQEREPILDLNFQFLTL